MRVISGRAILTASCCLAERPSAIGKRDRDRERQERGDFGRAPTPIPPGAVYDEGSGLAGRQQWRQSDGSMMFGNQVDELGAGFANVASGQPGSAGMEFAQLLSTVVSAIHLNDNRLLEVEGRDRDGAARWRVSIRGSARFTFSHSSERGSWLVEANFDVGGKVRSSEQAMILAMRGAMIESFRVEGETLFIRSNDGRAIEVPCDLNEDGIVINILPDEVGRTPTQIVLGTSLDDGD
jgi:hypothetical protein